MSSTTDGQESSSAPEPAVPESNTSSSVAEPNTSLTPDQLHALFDILTHHETYSEIESFKYPSTITTYGYPFKPHTTIPSETPTSSRSRSKSPIPPPSQDDSLSEEKEIETGTSPVLQTLFTRFVLPLPWLRDLPRDFWSVRIQGLLWGLADADLSESYDKGALGLRKTLATGASALIELLGRGILGGVRKLQPEVESKSEDESKKVEGEEAYDLEKAEDLERAWEEFVQQLVHGDLVPEMFEYMTKTDDLEGYSPTMKAAADYTLIHLATFMHHIFITSPEGAYLLQLLRNVHNLIPYKMVKQTLRIGNAATMINGMLRLLLAKLSVGGITNWMGLTKDADDGMNLLQRIISLVLSWDADVFRKSAEKLEKQDAVSEDALKTLKEFIEQEERVKHDAVREMSRTSAQSIIFSALNATDNIEVAASLHEDSHSQALEYYSALLSIHDREALTNVLCKSQPDLFTSIVREIVGSYEPFIRMLHQGVDLREYLEAVQGFIDEFIKVGEKGKQASVGDYVELLRRNKGLMYRWINAVAGNCEEVWRELEVWCKKIVVKFQQQDGNKDMNGRLGELFGELEGEKKKAVLERLDAHAQYLSSLETTSRKNMQHLLTSKSETQHGPGIYLSRWQHLLNSTSITPSLPVGPVRSGQDVKHTLAMGKGSIVGEKKKKKTDGDKDNKKRTAENDSVEETPVPDVSIVVGEMGEGFAEVLRDIGGPDF